MHLRFHASRERDAVLKTVWQVGAFQLFFPYSEDNFSAVGMVALAPRKAYDWECPQILGGAAFAVQRSGRQLPADLWEKSSTAEHALPPTSQNDCLGVVASATKQGCDFSL
jgi:hypothetical protein